jgi:hypothetical protein
MKNEFLCKSAVVVVLCLAVSSLSARPHLLRGSRSSYETVQGLPLAPSGPDQPVVAKAAPSKIPPDLEPPQDQVLLFSLRAEGVQIYESKPTKNDPMKYEWVLKAPDAILYDDHGEKAGTHFAGPTWQATDGSKVVAAKKASCDAPDGRAVPWLLLQAKSHEAKGDFSKVTFIQRVDTWAGMPPSDAATNERADKEVRVKYEATYRFYGKAP